MRPGGEAILLAGVALGCVQLGWGAIFPSAVGLAPASTATDEGHTAAAPPLRSPFAPMAAAGADPAGPHAAALAGVKVVGVRQADIAEDSGAILAFPDGRQRPFLVGHEIAEGLVLSRVERDHVMVAFDGGEQSIPIDGAASSGSFALALMGRSSTTSLALARVDTPSLAAPVRAADQSKAGSVAAAGVSASGIDAQWLAETMSHVEMRNGAPYAWRVASAPPKIATDAGLEVGDLILTVNGNPPGEPAAVLAAASSRQIQIAVERPSGERKIVTLANGMPS